MDHNVANKKKLKRVFQGQELWKDASFFSVKPNQVIRILKIPSSAVSVRYGQNLQIRKFI